MKGFWSIYPYIMTSVLKYVHLYFVILLNSFAVKTKVPIANLVRAEQIIYSTIMMLNFSGVINGSTEFGGIQRVQ